MISNLESQRKKIRQVIGRNITSLRAKNGLSRQALSKVMGVTYQQIYKYETGLNNISADQIVFLKFLLNANYDEFFKDLY